jgi:hypothetical protein
MAYFGKHVGFQAGKNVVGVPLVAACFPVPMPFARHVFKCLPRDLLDQAWIDFLDELFPRRLVARPRLSQGHIRIHAEGERLVLALESIVEPPVLAAVRHDVQV